MAQFYASIKGQGKTEATRTGSKNSGISGHVRGWDSGVKVIGIYNEETETDEFFIYGTRGSRGDMSNEIYLGKVTEDNTEGMTFIPE